MFFVREQSVKIIGILLLLNINCSLAEPPASSYLPPNRDDQTGQFSSANPTGQTYNTNKAPIETSVSLTTSEPFSYNPSSSGDTRNPSANTYGPPNSQNLPNNRIPSNVRGSGNNNNINNVNDFNRGSPIRNQQPPAGNSGYSYQQPSSPFKLVGSPNAGQTYQSADIGISPQPSTFGGQNYQSVGPGSSPQSTNSFGQVEAQNGGQGYQYAGPANSPQLTSFSPGGTQSGGQGYQSAGGPTNLPPVNSFNPVGTQNGGQGYQSAGPTNTPTAISNNYFSSPLPSLSPVYGVPSNTSGGYGGSPGNTPSFSSNLLDRRPTATSPNTQPNLFRPSTNNQGSASPTGNVQGFSQNFPGFSTNYGPPSTAGSSFGNFSPFGGNFNPASNPFGLGNSPVNQNINPFLSSGPSNTPSGRPLGNFGAPNAPQTLYGPPTPNDLSENTNFPGRRPSNAFERGGSLQTQYGPPIQTPGDRFSPQGNRNKGTLVPPSPTYGPPPNKPQFGGVSQSFRPQEFDRLNQNTRPFDNSGAGYQNSSSPARPAPSQLYGAPFSNTPSAGYSQGLTQEGPYPSSVGPASSISPGSAQNTYNSPQNQARPSSPSFSSSSLGYQQNSQNQPQPPSSTYGLPPQSQNNPSQTSPFNTLGNPTSTGFDNSGVYEAPRSPSNALPSNSGFSTSGSYEAPRSPPNGIPTGSGGFSTNKAYEAPRTPINSIPSSSSPLGNSVSPVYGTPSTNSLNQGFASPNEQGYPSSSAGSSGFSNISPTTEAAQAINFNSLSSSYSLPTRDYTDALLGDYNTPTAPEAANTFSNNPNSYEQYSNTGENPSPSQNQGTPVQSAYSAFPPSPSPSFNEPPSRLYEAPRPSNEFTNGESSPQINSIGPTNAGTQSAPNFSTNPASSYLPPNQSADVGISNDIIPSTSYTLQSDQPNSARPEASNTVKNTNRNVGSDLITGASTSPFLPFKDDSSKPNAAPSRATYEKSQEVTSNDLGNSEYNSAKPAKYQFNYDVKGSGPEFSHQESRNGTTTSGSYGVVLPDGRKQVVDYEANQEGFHPKIRYEETPNNSLQQNNDQSRGYNYSPNTPSAQNFSQSFTPNIDSELQPPYPSRPDYSLGTAADQGSYTSPYSQSGYSNNDQGSESNYNTYSNQGTSSGSPDKFTYDSNSNSGYPAKSAPEQNIPFYT